MGSLVAVAMAAVCSAGCSTAWFGRTVIPPEVRIADLELLESGLFEQRFRVTLRVLNPNDFSLPVDGLRFGLQLNDQPFARGFTSHGVTVPRLGDATIAVEATTSTLDIIRQVLAATSGRETLTYALEGTAFLGGSPRRIPFEQAGMLQLLPSDAVRRLVPAAPAAPPAPGAPSSLEKRPPSRAQDDASVEGNAPAARPGATGSDGREVDTW
jgi:LEA14-like dessication related protein